MAASHHAKRNKPVWKRGVLKRTGGDKYRLYGVPLPDVYQVRLKPDQSIAGFLEKVSSGCVARERYSDGTLFFSGAPTPRQCKELGITAKPGWRPEVRHSRTLNLCVQSANGLDVPDLSVADAVQIVKQSCLWDDMVYIELVQVACNKKLAHVYVQFEGETIARQCLNCVDAQEDKIDGNTYYVHGNQLNAYFEHNPMSPLAEGSLKWYNTAFIGARCAVLTVKQMYPPKGPRKHAKKYLHDTPLVRVVRQLVGGIMDEAEIVRRVDTKKGGYTHLLIHTHTEAGSGTLVGKLAHLVGQAIDVETCRLQVVNAAAWQGRQGDVEICDRVVWQAPISVATSEEEESTVSEESAPHSSVLSTDTTVTDVCEWPLPDDVPSPCDSLLAPTWTLYDDAMLQGFYQ